MPGELKRYRAVAEKLVSHPVKRGFVGWERCADPKQTPDLIVPDGERYALMPDGEVLSDSATLRKAARAGSLEALPLDFKSDGPSKAKKG